MTVIPACCSRLNVTLLAAVLDLVDFAATTSQFVPTSSGWLAQAVILRIVRINAISVDSAVTALATLLPEGMTSRVAFL